MKRSKNFSGERQSVSAARRFATEALVGTAEEVLQAVELMVSELATNCVRHVKSGFHLTVQSGTEEIRVEVTDYGGGTPEMRSPGPEEPTGRGLMIVDMLSETWGVETQAPDGKTVWFTLTAPAPTGEASTEASVGSPEPARPQSGHSQSPPERAGQAEARSGNGRGSPELCAGAASDRGQRRRRFARRPRR